MKADVFLTLTEEEDGQLLKQLDERCTMAANFFGDTREEATEALAVATKVARPGRVTLPMVTAATQAVDDAYRNVCRTSTYPGFNGAQKIRYRQNLAWCVNELYEWQTILTKAQEFCAHVVPVVR